MTDSTSSAEKPTALSTTAARNLATTTKSAPQMQGITPRWLMRMLPWVEVKGGTYRLNRRRSHALEEARVSFTRSGSEVRVVAGALKGIGWLAGFEDGDVLEAIAGRFVQREVQAEEEIAAADQPADAMFLVAEGKVRKLGVGRYGDPVELGVCGDGDSFGERAVLEGAATWPFTARALTRATLLVLPRAAIEQILADSPALREHLARLRARLAQPQDKHGQTAIDLAAGHRGEPVVPRTFVDYEPEPREYQLHVAQAVLRVHTRVVDLYSQPMNQLEEQLRLTVEALRERQEHELLNDPEFGLLHNAAVSQRLPTKSGPPTPDDLDELLCRRRGSRFFLAHPRAIAAFGRECNRRGLYPAPAEVAGRRMQAWRGVPILPCDKIPITPEGTSSILVLRTGAEDQGVVGLHQTGLPDEREPGLSVRHMGIDEKATLSYLVSAYYSAAILVPDALGLLEHVVIGHRA